MSETKYRTTPLPSPDMPPGIPYIIGNEAAERFSFYGMKAILFVFMTEHLLDASGAFSGMKPPVATMYVHLFNVGVYFLPIFGAILADAFLGKYRTIIWLSIVYCLGHLALALNEPLYWLKGTSFHQIVAGYQTRYGLAAGLLLISLGAGGIKPCVSAHVGDQFGKQNDHLLSKVFSWFYFSINFGSFFSTLLTPWLLEKYGASVAFGVPGVLMSFATIVFWMGRHKFIHVPPGGLESVKEAVSGDGLTALKNLSLIYLFVAVFWSLYDQTGSMWVDQAKHMNLRWMGVDWYSSQIQAVNPILILLFIPLFTYVVYPAINRVFPLTPLRKISIGLFLMVVTFSLSAWIEIMIQRGAKPTIGWQIVAYLVLTAAEVLVSITGLEFSYTQAPRKMKSFVMSLWLLSVAVGNGFTVAVNFFIQNKDGSSRLSGPAYYWFFTCIMLVAALAFIAIAATYRGKTYIQGDEAAAADLA